MPNQSQVADRSHFMSFKTKKCRHFELGRCRLGERCNFAHGDNEIGLRDRQPEHLTLLSKEQLSSLSMSKPKCESILLEIEKNLERMIGFQKTCLQNLKVNTFSYQNQGNQFSQNQVA